MDYNEEIEMQLWEYIDGTCPVADMQRISILIERDDTWKEKYNELSVLHNSLAKNLELEHPPLRFTQNVMDAVAKEHVAPATKQYINKSIIRGIAAIFFLMLATIFGYALTSLTGHVSPTVSKFNFNLPDVSNLFSNTMFHLVMAVNVVIGLVLLDTILRRKRTRHTDAI